MAMPMRAGLNPKSSSSDMIHFYGIRATAGGKRGGRQLSATIKPSVVLAKPTEGRLQSILCLTG